MVTIFNRKELYITFSMEEQSRIRSVLAAANIDYALKVSGGVRSTGGHRTVAVGIRGESQYLYKFYVKKADYERALHRIHNDK